MTHSNSPEPRPGFIRRIWNWFWTPTAVLSTGFVLIAGFLAGILFWGGFHWSMEMTNTEEFCTGCHTMETNLGEYRETIHYNNHSGVRAICSDCHVPKEWNHKVKAKVMAVKDIYHELMGTIDTPEKYEEHRLKMAAQTWKKMKQSDSRECRNCHNFDYMDFTIQESRAASEHQRAIDNNMTCIDCHQGIAHRLPEGYLKEYKRVVDELDMTPKSEAQKDAQIDVDGIRSFLKMTPSENHGG
ncbi:NapC/NirT family cytochrome c [Shimia thalassica]|uniref:NapC/NirT family cytochrome c n=1 Tax=Shimia thalassica TaxID=1715693 RepID=UPI0026E1D033|nr:NapC/NirT family cytochrome c [Shimia thalassica]MDO6483227.1 NapC/NirT family cytochrome c [Shimia thalassica]